MVTFINEINAQVTITVKDINDAAPEFVSANSIMVMENTPINSVLLVVKAIDRDEGRNGYVEYTLHNEKATFSLGVVDGLLRVIGDIDREDVSNYTLSVSGNFLVSNYIFPSSSIFSPFVYVDHCTRPWRSISIHNARAIHQSSRQE